MNDACLGGIVCSLQLRDVDNVSTHAGRSDEAAIREVFELLPIECGHLLLLASPMLASSPGTVEGRVKVRSHNLAVVVKLSVEHRALRPRDTSIGHEDVEAVVELLDDVVDDFFDVLGVGHIDLVGLAYV